MRPTGSNGPRPWPPRWSNASGIPDRPPRAPRQALGDGFFIAERDAANLLIAQPKSPTDGAVPSGNSVAVRALAELGRRNGDQQAIDRSLATIAAFAESVERAPAAYTYMLTGLAVALDGDAGPRGTAGRGAVTVAASLRPGPASGEYEVDLDLVIGNGWHLNGPEPAPGGPDRHQGHRRRQRLRGDRPPLSRTSTHPGRHPARRCPHLRRHPAHQVPGATGGRCSARSPRLDTDLGPAPGLRRPPLPAAGNSGAGSAAAPGCCGRFAVATAPRCSTGCGGRAGRSRRRRSRAKRQSGRPAHSRRGPRRSAPPWRPGTRRRGW